MARPVSRSRDWDGLGSDKPLLDCQQSSAITNFVDNVSFRAIIGLIIVWKFFLN